MLETSGCAHLLDLSRHQLMPMMLNHNPRNAPHSDVMPVAAIKGSQ